MFTWFFSGFPEWLFTYTHNHYSVATPQIPKNQKLQNRNCCIRFQLRYNLDLKPAGKIPKRPDR